MSAPRGEQPRFIDKLKLFDFYSKSTDDVPLNRTSAGGIFTVFTVILLLYLVISEVVNYSSSRTEDVLTVDVRRGEKLPIYLDIYFPSLQCRDVAVDVVDGTSGETIEDASHQIIRQRVSPGGHAMSDNRQAELGKTDASRPGCMGCTLGIPPHLLALARHPPACCNTCDSLREYFTSINVPQRFADHTPQCKLDIPYSDAEGCRVHGFINVPRARGDFHIAAGKGFGQSHDSHSHHMHAIDWDRIDKFNITHSINGLSFGPPIPGMVNPLDKKQFTSRHLAQHSYFIQVVPTIYRQGEEVIRTNQYSYTQHNHRVDRGAPTFALPGLYFKYDISPIMIQITEKDRPFADFLTNLCAIVGGIYVAFGIVYSLSSTAVTKTTTRKKEK